MSSIVLAVITLVGYGVATIVLARSAIEGWREVWRRRQGGKET